MALSAPSTPTSITEQLVPERVADPADEEQPQADHRQPVAARYRGPPGEAAAKIADETGKEHGGRSEKPGVEDGVKNVSSSGT